jgi:hypothetical protein
MSKRRRSHEEPKTSNQETAERIRKLREINRAAAADRISWEDRVQQSNEVVPGLGPLDDRRPERNGNER